MDKNLDLCLIFHAESLSNNFFKLLILVLKFPKLSDSYVL